MEPGRGAGYGSCGEAPRRLVVRRACAADLPRILEIQEVSIRVLGAPAYGDARAQAWARFGVRLSHGLLSQGTFFVGDIDGCVIGVSGWSPDADRGDTAWLRYVFVHPDAVNRGIGRRLVARVEASATKAARRRLRLWSSLNAIGFYEALGYRRLRHARWTVEPGVELDYLLMGKG